MFLPSPFFFFPFPWPLLWQLCCFQKERKKEKRHIEEYHLFNFICTQRVWLPSTQLTFRGCQGWGRE